MFMDPGARPIGLGRDENARSFGRTKPRQEVPVSRRRKEQASHILPKRSHRSENIQELNDIMRIFYSITASLQACKTGSHVASKCSRVAFIPGGSIFLRAGAGLATLDHYCCRTGSCDYGIV